MSVATCKYEWPSFCVFQCQSRHLWLRLKLLSTPCWIVFYAVRKNTPVSFVNRSGPKLTAAIFPRQSNPRPSLLTFVSVRFSDQFMLLKKVSRKPIRYVTIHVQDRSSAALTLSQKSIQYPRFVCEPKPYRICFWCQVYPVCGPGPVANLNVLSS